MATFNSTTFGAISGRHGSAVAATTKDGKSILKVFKAPGNPNTQKQQTQRSKFGFVNRELSCMRNLFKITFRSNNGMQQAVSAALKNAVVGEAPDWTIDYSALQLSVGSVDAAMQLVVSKNTASNVQLSWDKTVAANSSANDWVNCVFFNNEHKMAIIKQNNAIRSDGTVAVDLPEVWAGTEIHCWIYFTNSTDTLNSTSKFVGLVQL